MQILLAEDNDVLRNAIAHHLEGLGHEVQLASNGNEAISLINQQRFDCVVTDIYMPEKDGFEVVRYVACHAASTRVVAISGMVGSYGMDCLAVAERFGAHATLEKPFNFQQLDAMLIG
jgi:CheY-like chemotaxis protein